MFLIANSSNVQYLSNGFDLQFNTIDRKHNNAEIGNNVCIGGLQSIPSVLYETHSKRYCIYSSASLNMAVM